MVRRQFGLVAEMLQTGHEGLLEVIASLFTDLLRGDASTPASWRSIILFKKGDVNLPKNYRPITILPVLCKIFSKLLLHLISGSLDDLRTPE